MGIKTMQEKAFILVLSFSHFFLLFQIILIYFSFSSSYPVHPNSTSTSILLHTIIVCGASWTVLSTLIVFPGAPGCSHALHFFPQSHTSHTSITQEKPPHVGALRQT